MLQCVLNTIIKFVITGRCRVVTEKKLLQNFDHVTEMKVFLHFKAAVNMTNKLTYRICLEEYYVGICMLNSASGGGHLLYSVSQEKQNTLLVLITLQNINRFSKFFHC